MTNQAPTSAPEGFIVLLQRAIHDSGLTLRELGRKAGISHAYLSLLLNRERGVPADETINRLEEILRIPHGKLLYEAGRTDAVAQSVLTRNGARLLMRRLAPLTDDQLHQVQKYAEELRSKNPSKTK